MGRMIRSFLTACLLLCKPGWTAAPPDLLGHFDAWLKDPWDAERLTKELEKQNALSVAAALGILPLWLRSSFTLVKRSGDLEEGASAMAPRVILFSPDGTLQVSFGGRSDKEILKIAQFHPHSDRLVFTMISFDTAKGRRTVRTCTGCHGKDPNYIIDQYPTWHGWYGGDDDAFLPQTKDAKEFLAFRNKAREHPRYQKLVFDARSVFYPFHETTLALGKDAPDRGFSAMPNARLTALINRLQSRIFYRKIQASPLFPSLKYALAFFLLQENRSIAPLLGKAGRTCSMVKGETARLGQRILRRLKLPSNDPIAAIFALLGLPKKEMRLSSRLAQPSRRDSYLDKPWEFSDGFFRMRDFIQEHLWRDLVKESPGLGVFYRSQGMKEALSIAAQNFSGARFQRKYHLSDAQSKIFDSLGKAMLVPPQGKAGFEKACRSTALLAWRALEASSAILKQ